MTKKDKNFQEQVHSPLFLCVLCVKFFFVAAAS